MQASIPRPTSAGTLCWRPGKYCHFYFHENSDNEIYDDNLLSDSHIVIMIVAFNELSSLPLIEWMMMTPGTSSHGTEPIFYQWKLTFCLEISLSHHQTPQLPSTNILKWDTKVDDESSLMMLMMTMTTSASWPHACKPIPNLIKFLGSPQPILQSKTCRRKSLRCFFSDISKKGFKRYFLSKRQEINPTLPTSNSSAAIRWYFKWSEKR